jgi:DNA-binding response OmpR family regulator
MANSPDLTGRRVLVAEDEFFIADDLKAALAKAGADVIGPAPTVDEALRLLSGQNVDFAVLDINLEGEKVFTLADTLAGRGVPFVFATGYDLAVVPERFCKIRRWQKPFNATALVASLPRTASRRSGHLTDR